MNKENPHHEYKGYKYCPWDDREEDCIKTFHDVYTPEDENIHLDYSPYSSPSFECFCKWVDMSCPKRPSPFTDEKEWVEEVLGHTGNFDNNDIEKLWSAFLKTYMRCPWCKHDVLMKYEDGKEFTLCCDQCGGSFQIVQEPQYDLIKDALKV